MKHAVGMCRVGKWMWRQGKWDADNALDVVPQRMLVTFTLVQAVAHPQYETLPCQCFKLGWTTRIQTLPLHWLCFRGCMNGEDIAAIPPCCSQHNCQWINRMT